VYADDARELVYLVNGEGLWIARHYMPPRYTSAPQEMPWTRSPTVSDGTFTWRGTGNGRDADS
jgi:hypothetical protein